MLHMDVPRSVPTRGSRSDHRCFNEGFQVALANYLRRRGATYSVRVPVPVDLQPVVGKTEIVKALGRVRDPADAKRKGPAAAQEIHDWFDQLRGSLLLRTATRVGAEVQHVTIATPSKSAADGKRQVAHSETEGDEWDLEEACDKFIAAHAEAAWTAKTEVRQPAPPWTCSSTGRGLERP
jgi:hypothetical protein